MNTHEQEKTISLTMIGVALVVVMAMFLMSGCAYNRKTEDGALAKATLSFELLPSGSSDDDIALSNKAIETTTANADRTNAHTSGIEKTKATANIATTTIKGPTNPTNSTSKEVISRENVRN